MKVKLTYRLKQGDEVVVEKQIDAECSGRRIRFCEPIIVRADQQLEIVWPEEVARRIWWEGGVVP